MIWNHARRWMAPSIRLTSTGQGHSQLGLIGWLLAAYDGHVSPGSMSLRSSLAKESLRLDELMADYPLDEPTWHVQPWSGARGANGWFFYWKIEYPNFWPCIDSVWTHHFKILQKTLDATWTRTVEQLNFQQCSSGPLHRSQLGFTCYHLDADDCPANGNCCISVLYECMQYLSYCHLTTVLTQGHLSGSVHRSIQDCNVFHTPDTCKMHYHLSNKISVVLSSGEGHGKPI